MPPLLTFLCLHPLPLSPLIVSTLSSERSKRCHSWNLPPQGPPPSPIPSSWRAFSSSPEGPMEWTAISSMLLWGTIQTELRDNRGVPGTDRQAHVHTQIFSGDLTRVGFLVAVYNYPAMCQSFFWTALPSKCLSSDKISSSIP